MLRKFKIKIKNLREKSFRNYDSTDSVNRMMLVKKRKCRSKLASVKTT